VIQGHSLMPLLTDPQRLKRAARGCMRAASSPGVDGVTWRAYRTELNDRIDELARRLRDGSWEPGPIRLVQWHTGEKILTVAIPTVEDRIVHRALRCCVEPILNAYAYPEWMFGWRPRQGRVHALRYAQQHGIPSPCWVADIDITRATAGGTVDEAVDWLAEWVHDGGFLATVRTALDGLPTPLAPGSGLSPLLTNLRLARIDRALKAFTVIRVTDNYVIFTANQTEAQAAFEHLAKVLAAHGLAPHPTKSKVWQPNLEDLFLAG
jgi:RNA-directed DNA polymerase